MKKFRLFARLSLSRSHLPYGLNFCSKKTQKKSKMRKFPTEGLMKSFQLIWFVLMIMWLRKANWKSKEPSERINKLYALKQVTRKTITNYSPLNVIAYHLTYYWMNVIAYHLTYYIAYHLTYYLLNKFWD